MIKKYQILKEQIDHAIQSSGLDVGAVYFIVKDIQHSLEKMYYSKINYELMEENNQKKNSENKNSDAGDIHE